MRNIEISQELPKEAQIALGYLTMWGLEGYNEVGIYPDSSVGEKGLIAHYRNTESGHRFVMGAVWDKDKQQYSFHS